MKLIVGVLVFCNILFAMVDINHADVKQLSALQGIGKAKALKIVEYRKANGCFKDLSQLTNVKGIGKGTFNKNKENIKITPCK